MADEFGADLMTIVDDEGNRHQFELLDAIETDDGRYVALLPVYDQPEESVQEDGEELLVTIDDDDIFNEIAEIFEDRLSDLYEIDSADDEE